jgi:hypothetical protein
MPKFSFVLDVAAPPDEVIGKMVDFSDRRPEIWPNLSAKIYKAHSVEASSADVTEGSDVPGSQIWARESYEWSDNEVKSVITDSNIFQPGGTFELRVEPEGSGTRIHFSTDRRAKTVMARLVGVFMQLSKGAPIRKSYYAVYGKPS